MPFWILTLKSDQDQNQTKRKNNTYDRADALYEQGELTLNVFKIEIFPLRSTQGKRRPPELATRFKILTSKQMLRRFLVALVQVQARDTSEKLLNKIRQMIYSLYREKEITKKVYNNIMYSKEV